MTDFKKIYTSKLEKSQEDMSDCINELSKIYNDIKTQLKVLVISISLYFVGSIIFSRFSQIDIFACVLIHLICCLIITFVILRLFNVLKLYKNSYEKGFSEWCRLADIADWSPLRRHYYFKREEHSQANSILNLFYAEINRPLSPCRMFGKRIYNIVYFLIITVIAIIIASIYFKIN